ncbi:MAG: hypothetical protein Q8M09_05210 [Pseudomonadota bacterium]|nr:hypothetical protein [Pseudomonadota bacterium]MDP1903633.1 hypothetical protein [Pseudomonadota bacterium]MDP2353899.1 hypothetical protein [Pseudomonadota bacterium]
MALMSRPISSRTSIEQTYQDSVVSQGMPAGLSFSLALPRGWHLRRREAVTIPGPGSPVVELARFAPATENALGWAEGAEVVILAAFLPREMHGRDWLRAWVDSQGYSVMDSREASTPFGIMGDVLASRTRDGIRKLHRLTTFKDADLIFLLDGRASYEHCVRSPSIQEIFLLAVIRFRLLEPTRQLFAEGFEPVTLEGTARVSFLASGLWTSRPGGDAPTEGASLIFDNLLDQRVVGTLVAVLGSVGMPATELEAITLTKLANQGYSYSAQTQPAYEVVKPDSEVVVRSAMATRDSANFTVTSARITLDSIPVSLVLITPTESASFEAWAVNNRVFEIALNSMRVEVVDSDPGNDR